MFNFKKTIEKIKTAGVCCNFALLSNNISAIENCINLNETINNRNSMKIYQINNQIQDYRRSLKYNRSIVTKYKLDKLEKIINAEEINFYDEDGKIVIENLDCFTNYLPNNGDKLKLNNFEISLIENKGELGAEGCGYYLVGLQNKIYFAKLMNNINRDQLIDIINNKIKFSECKNIITPTHIFYNKNTENYNYNLITLFENYDSDLFDALRENKYKLEDTLHISKGIIDGINEIHNKGITHGDLKLENILIRENKTTGKFEVAITDLGAATEDEKIYFYNTSQYWSPEIKENIIHYNQNLYPAKAQDMYALGFVLLEILKAKIFKEEEININGDKYICRDLIEDLKDIKIEDKFFDKIDICDELSLKCNMVKFICAKLLCTDPNKRLNIKQFKESFNKFLRIASPLFKKNI